MIKLENVTCEHMRDPLSVAVQKPVFCWQLFSDESDCSQTAWRIVVKDEQGRATWDSGVREGKHTLDIPYEGEPLRPASRYTVTVTAWDNHSGSVTAESRFETAFFATEDWSARWIEPDPLPQLPENPLKSALAEWAAYEAAYVRGENPVYKSEVEIMESLPLEPYDPALCLRKRFTAKGPVQSARLYVTAHGLYDVTINGAPATKSWLNPGFTTYDKRLRYQVFDVTACLREGENRVLATVADGWYKGKITFGRGCEYGEVPGLLFELRLQYANGDTETICTDGSWEYSFDGPVRSSDMFMGENYDARFDVENGVWKPVRVVAAPDETLEAQTCPEAVVIKELPAKRLWTAPNGDLLVDFGQNLAGALRVEIEGEAGETVSFSHGEELDENGNYFYVFDNTNKSQTDTYVCRGDGVEVYEPKFTYHGFRYVRVRGGRNWTKERFTALALSAANVVTGSFACSDGRLNQLQSNILWSQRGNNVALPTDCPTREKAGWTGDVVVYGATALYNQDMTAFYHDWLRSIRVEQREDGHVLGCVPKMRCYISQAGAGSLGWGDVIVTLPWQLYTLMGDRSALLDNYDAMGKWLTAMRKQAAQLPPEYAAADPNSRKTDNQRYLINTGFHFGDWIIPSVVNEAGFTDGAMSAFLTMNYADTSLLARLADLYAEISRLLGHTENAEDAEQYARRVREAFCEEYVIDGARLGQEMQGNYILALKFRMVPEDVALRFAARLNELIAQNGYHLDTGFMSTPHILDVLCDYGYQDTAWRVLFQDTCPSWLYEIINGATTVWENWDGIRPDGKRADCSFNHYAFGCVGDFLYRRVLGIQNAGVAYDHIRIAPEYSCPLTEAHGVYQSARGEIAVAWKKDGGTLTIEGSLPANTCGELHLPDGSVHILKNGKFSETCNL